MYIASVLKVYFCAEPVFFYAKYKVRVFFKNTIAHSITLFPLERLLDFRSDLDASVKTTNHIGRHPLNY